MSDMGSSSEKKKSSTPEQPEITVRVKGDTISFRRKPSGAWLVSTKMVDESMEIETGKEASVVLALLTQLSGIFISGLKGETTKTTSPTESGTSSPSSTSTKSGDTT